jgi:hypothetical protein
MPPASEAGQPAGSPIEPSEPSTPQSGAGVQPGQESTSVVAPSQSETPGQSALEPTPAVAPSTQTPADQAVIDNDKQTLTAPEPTPQPGPTPPPSDFDVQQSQSAIQSPPLNPGSQSVQPEPTPQPGPTPQPAGLAPTETQTAQEEPEQPFADQVKSSLSSFEGGNPDAKGKAYLTAGGGSRTVDDQVRILVNPRYAGDYPVQERFKTQFKVKSLPSYDNLTDDQRTWLENEVSRQAGKSPGFAHVGGYAQDISVKNLSVDERKALSEKLNQDGFSVLNETYDKNGKSKFKVKTKDATVFHVYKDDEQ